MNRMDQDFIVQKIRTEYTDKKYSRLEELKALDLKVRKPAILFGYVFGTVAAIIMGSGMSLVMTDIGTTLGISNTMLPGIIIGIIGMLAAIINYPIYKSILNYRKKKYAKKILELSEKVLGE
ncbi:MAG: dihydropteridine reductase [Ruminococcaceae bacterium]|nr:dihydropteridine reductase [Oscillospiraceae bacterium]